MPWEIIGNQISIYFLKASRQSLINPIRGLSEGDLAYFRDVKFGIYSLFPPMSPPPATFCSSCRFFGQDPYSVRAGLRNRPNSPQGQFPNLEPLRNLKFSMAASAKPPGYPQILQPRHS
jgi:hypothetical protein